MMNYFDIGKKFNFPPILFNPVTKIQVLSVPKVFFIKPFHFIPDCFPDKHKGSGTTVYFMNLIHYLIPQMISVQKCTFFKNAGYTCELAKCIPWSRKPPVTGVIYLPIWQFNFACC